MGCETEGLGTSPDAGGPATGCAMARDPAMDGAAKDGPTGSVVMAGGTTTVAAGCTSKGAKAIKSAKLATAPRRGEAASPQPKEDTAPAV